MHIDNAVTPQPGRESQGIVFLDWMDIAILFRGNRHVAVVWGSGGYAEQVRRTLAALGVPVAGFCTGKRLSAKAPGDGGKEITLDELAAMPHARVFLGTPAFQSARQELESLGIYPAYAVLNCLKYDLPTHLFEREELAAYFRRSVRENSTRVLVEMYGNIGDLVIKTGIVRRLLTRFGPENVHFVCDRLRGDAAYDFLTLFSNNVITIDRDRFASDRSYRMELLHLLNNRHFSFSFALCNITFHSRRRCLNPLNFNVDRVYVREALHFHEYMPTYDARFYRDIFPEDSAADISPEGQLAGPLAATECTVQLPKEYVSVCMGASNNIRRPGSQAFAQAFDRIIGHGFHVVVVGEGAEDERYCNEVLAQVTHPDKVLPRISLPLRQSLHVVARSRFFLGVESGMWNAAHVLGIPSIVTYGGGDYYGFKHESADIEYVMVNDRSCFGCRWECSRLGVDGSAPCIAGIDGARLLASLEKIVAKAKKMEGTCYA